MKIVYIDEKTIKYHREHGEQTRFRSQGSFNASRALNVQNRNSRFFFSQKIVVKTKIIEYNT